MSWTGKVKISKVESHDGGHAISFGPNVFFLQDGQNLAGLVPKVDDDIDVKVHGGTFVAGVKINDEIVFDMSEKEIEVESKKLASQVDKQRRELFLKMQPDLDRDYAALGPEFKSRIDRFRFTNPDFRWKYEAYEMAVTKAAVSIAAKFPNEDEIIRFKKMDFDTQLDLVPEIYDFSGHMVGFACLLAGCFVVAPHEVVNVPGALAPMLGVKEYG
jgi:hypothetical protein